MVRRWSVEDKLDSEAKERLYQAGQVIRCCKKNISVHYVHTVLTHPPLHEYEKGNAMKRLFVIVLAFGLAAGTLVAQDKTEKKEATKQETKKEKCDMDGCCKKECKMMKKSDSKKSSTKTETKKEEVK